MPSPVGPVLPVLVALPTDPDLGRGAVLGPPPSAEETTRPGTGATLFDRERWARPPVPPRAYEYERVLSVSLETVARRGRE
jgi:hypothetical protein